jgi:hypothetical protein
MRGAAGAGEVTSAGEADAAGMSTALLAKRPTDAPSMSTNDAVRTSAVWRLPSWSNRVLAWCISTS